MIELYPIMLDIEASGFGRGSYPIEIGVALEDGSEQSWLVRPLPEWQHWSDEAESMHGLERQLLIAQGAPLREVAESLNRLLEGRVVYTDGWGFDSSWLALLFYHAKRRQAFRLESLAAIITDGQMAIWHQTKQELRQAQTLAYHRAGPDAQVLQQTWLKTKQMSEI